MVWWSTRRGGSMRPRPSGSGRRVRDEAASAADHLQTVDASRPISMSSLNTELAEILSTVERPGDFFASGTVEMLAPRLEVEGVGQIALPLLPVQAEQLV